MLLTAESCVLGGTGGCGCWLCLLYSMEYIDGLKSTSSLGLHESKSHISLALKGPSEIIRDNSFTDGPEND